MLRISLILLTLLFPLLSGTTALAADGGNVADILAEPEGDPVRAELLHESSALIPGSTSWIAIRLEQDEGWHTYWRNGGDSGLPTEVSWTLPDGIEIGELQWPLPERYIESGGLKTYGYSDEVLLLAEVRSSADLQVGSTVRIEAEVDWLMCKALCIPGAQSVALELSVATDAPASAHAAKMMASLAEVPPLAETVEGIEFLSGLDLSIYPLGQGGHWWLEIEGLPADAELDWFPAPADGLLEKPLKSRWVGEKLQLLVPFDVDEFSDPGAELEFAGVLVADGRALEFSTVVPVAGDREIPALTLPASFEDWIGVEISTPPAPASSGSLPYYLLLAFVGGIILNIMPCVLPVLSLKVMGFVSHAQESRRRQFQLGLSFTFGVLASFLALAMVIVLLQRAGQQMGWGFQFQDPIFVLVMIGVVFAFGLSLFGVYEIILPMGSAASMGQGQGAHAESFFNGVLATALATPCTAPFLGTALGFAFSQPALVIISIFLSIGLGLSMPYLLLSANPAWLRWVPKPGAWMIAFKQGMGFLLMATLVWLLWVLGQQLGAEGVVWTLAFLTVLAAALWLWGLLVDFSSSQTRRTTVFLLVVAMISAGAWGFLRGPLAEGHPETVSADSHIGPGGLEWVNFSPERLADEVNAGRTVFLDFTAAWCWTCKVNERTVLAKDEVVDRIRELNVLPMMGDWTRRDPRITELLRAHGRSGVPFYAIYPANRFEDPIILPELITESIVVEALEQAGPSRELALKL